jgi:dTDP-4-dehydrorhamnose 3,5-epimerase-like enzyme
MSQILKLPTHTDNRGSLTILEKVLPFEIKRVYYIYNCSDTKRGGHRHKKNIQALICVKGSCVIDCNNGYEKKSVVLDKPDVVLVLMPEDFHTMHSFTKDAILLILASEYFDADDYIDEDYE